MIYKKLDEIRLFRNNYYEKVYTKLQPKIKDT